VHQASTLCATFVHEDGSGTSLEQALTHAGVGGIGQFAMHSEGFWPHLSNAALFEQSYASAFKQQR
jgi:hypothetical protein